MTEEQSASGTRPSLLVRLRDVADADAWQTFVTTYAPLVYSACRKHGLQDADAADLAQEVLTQVVRSMRTFEYQPERGRFRDWLWIVTRHRIARFEARRRHEVVTAGAEALVQTAGEPDPAWVADFNAQVLRVALQRIRPHFEAITWDAFEGTWRDDRPAPEVAAATGLPIDSVYAAKSRILKRLREEILILAADVPLYVPLS
jgi:RNA polymerase sigma-70 factor (ECF subfamily)